jgi:hypothetical protein
MSRVFYFLMFASLALLAACSSAPNEANFHFDFKTAPDTETYWCEFARMPHNDGKPVNVTGFRWSTSDAHHWALFRTANVPAASMTGKAFPCFDSSQTDMAAPASIVSQPTTEQTSVEYPEGYALPFAADELVMVQFHTVNASSVSVEPTLDLTATLADGPVKPIGQFQFYNPFIFAPAHGNGKASMRCAVPADLDLVTMFTHEHTRGVGVRVFLDPPNGPESMTPILSAGNWTEPASKIGVQHVKAGSHFRIFCDYSNPGNDDVFQGPNKLDSEMCQVYGGYSPPLPGPSAVLFEACVPAMIPGGTGDMYGTGTATCGDTLACVAACAPSDAPSFGRGKFPVGACWQKCLVRSCASASTQFNAVFACVQTKCATECDAGAGDPGCQACLGANCGNEVGACQTASCT